VTVTPEQDQVANDAVREHPFMAKVGTGLEVDFVGEGCVAPGTATAEELDPLLADLLPFRGVHGVLPAFTPHLVGSLELSSISDEVEDSDAENGDAAEKQGAIHLFALSNRTIETRGT
jgi:hypothetical protein